jgi:hypothetical protein
MLAEKEEQTALEPGGLRQWIMEHDDKWTFIAPYIGLAVVLSIVLSLFWLVVVVGVHFALELIRQWVIKPGWKGVILRSLWELKLDFGLILFGLALALYMDFVLGVAGLGAAGRAGAMAGARVGARVAVLQRVLRGILLSLDDLAQVVRVFTRRKGKTNDIGDALEEAIESAQPEPQEVGIGWNGPWGKGDYIAVGFGLLCLVLILVSPIITHHTADTALATLLEELHPLPGDD